MRVGDEPTATEGGDPSGLFKRWFGRKSGSTGWRGASIIDKLARRKALDDARRLSSRARPRSSTDGRSDAVALRLPCAAWIHARAGNGGVRKGSAVFFYGLQIPGHATGFARGRNRLPDAYRSRMEAASTSCAFAALEHLARKPIPRITWFTRVLISS